MRNRYHQSFVRKTLRNRFEIIKQLGSGGSGDTYLAIDLDLPGRPHCVVKHFHPKDSNPAVGAIAKKLFVREAEVLYQLGNDHEQIPRLFAHFDEGGDFYLVQEYIDGHSLTQEIIPGQRLRENAVLILLKDILEVLVFVHEHNIIHRDIKPQNLMRRHSDGKIVLIDFGSIKKIGALGAGLTVVVGTPGYMPSEQAKGKPKLSSDIYAVGMIGIQALTGLVPSQLQEDPETGEVIWRHHAQVSDAFADILDRMICDRHSQRYQSAAEALEAINSCLLGLESSPSAGQKQNIIDSYFLAYRNFILLLGIGLGASTSLIVIILIYTFLNASTFLPQQPTQLKNIIQKFIHQSQLTNLNNLNSNTELKKSNCSIANSTEEIKFNCLRDN
ncbi:serine/threonine protein kinase [Nostoc linckia z18]|uniref:non-specific serine/threonine protein kinase n=2 Tax=Nostoc linckia TaxID=92942 RepID=A0A9Q6ENW8_NOSLI|nr:serine/threonine protein kinase [Nostoc linckia z1]PHJ72964.1 serine/threonine protein kinase [Nostoc linckia z3]PHJ77532.1 serine/threonine protein kinase [Nostoc linckia z2]PHJ86592.1 serine/threonine protein kinase [Nostoc linckia z4]PHJ91306.1 serine/threonine protein kinase [Nostoc linckia z6]PHJ99122.1 serine/threonine protein kinase [Nostoc linckia z7]PHK05415.1 serine/threonine protein kinase [Nostoc linckia z9]PHK07531.1 serine/threonine protein kinase [Nostoc linckia z8]PHK1884